jgi:hypothetical protein
MSLWHFSDLSSCEPGTAEGCDTPQEPAPPPAPRVLVPGTLQSIFISRKILPARNAMPLNSKRSMLGSRRGRRDGRTPPMSNGFTLLASIVSSDRIVFNIRGNAYRLVVAVDFEKGIVWIKWLGTHRDYDRIDVRDVNLE